MLVFLKDNSLNNVLVLCLETILGKKNKTTCLVHTYGDLNISKVFGINFITGGKKPESKLLHFLFPIHLTEVCTCLKC